MSPWAIALMEEENGADIAYHLFSDKKEFARIAALPVISQIREIGKLSAKLASAPPKAKQPSKAPAPITPVRWRGRWSRRSPITPAARA